MTDLKLIQVSMLEGTIIQSIQKLQHLQTLENTGKYQF